MADAKRDRSKVSLAWLAHWALVYDDEDHAFVREYLDEALRVVSRIRSGETPPVELAELTIVLVGLREALDPNGGTRIFLKPELRKTSAQGGRRRLSYDEVLRRREAGARACRHYAGGDLLKAEAIERAWTEMHLAGRADGLSSRIIERAMDEHRRTIEALTVRQ